MGDRHLDTRILRTPKPDKMANQFPTLSPYSYAANNPIIFNDPNGQIISLSKMTAAQQGQYKAMVQTLSASSLFRYVHKAMQESDRVFYVDFNTKIKTGGQFDPSTSTVSLGLSTTTYVLAQEMFHGFQNDNKDKLYGGNVPIANIEAEGDVYSQYVAIEANIPAPMIQEWGEEIMGDYDVPSLAEMKSDKYRTTFKKALDNRINFYKTQVANGVFPKNMVAGYTSDAQDYGPNSLIMAKEGADDLEEKGRQERLQAIEE